MHDPKLILFDVDGTLIDSQHMICAAMDRTYRDHGLAGPPAAAVRAIIGLSLAEAVGRLSAGADHPVASLVEGYKTAFQALRLAGTVAVPLYPGARAAIDALRRRPDVLLGVATGKSRRGVAAMIDMHKLDNTFVTIQTADTSPSKPHPGMVLQAMAETGVAAADTVVVGDTAFDMQMARAAGASALGVSWGYHPVADLQAAGAHDVLDGFDALPSALDRLWPRGSGATASSPAMVADDA
ncbi:MAG: HAD-IA family hydrolase [Rhodopseudomonas sp.]|nr:HAD-IA family hydrolase [Rhodopseudomonas sp.]